MSARQRDTVLFALVSLIAACGPTPPSPPPPQVYQIVAEAGRVFVSGQLEKVPQTRGLQIASSSDDGLTWTLERDPPEDLVSRLEVKRLPGRLPIPKSICAANQKHECFRIVGERGIDRSDDGGLTWQMDWRPSERITYLDRVCSVNCYSNLTPFDLAVWEHGGLVLAATAMTYDGVMVRTADGRWQRVGVMEVIPTPYSAPNANIAIRATFGELILWLGIASLSAAALWMWGTLASQRRLQIRHGGPRYMRDAYGSLRPFAIVIIIVLLAIAALRFNLISVNPVFGTALMLIFCYAPPAAFLALIIGMAITWRYIAILAHKPRTVNHIATASVLVPIGLFVGGYGSIWLWAFGIIPPYELAVVVALMLSVVVIGIGIMHISRALACVE